jgi:uncharacterized coiled-coil DUF342 family protein
MGFLDKAKTAAAEAAAKAKEGAEFAAQKAKETGETVQTKRELGSAFDELGQKAFELVGNGAISHGELTPLVEKIRELQAKLESIGESEADAPVEEHAETPA